MDYSLERSGRDEANYERDHLSSSILNEDTDDFIVGDRVWVNGTTPGYIQFIGETKFSPGEWAGIVLDKPVGKHSGTVKGFEYFQCEPNRGMFSRLHRLTRFPLNEDVHWEAHNHSTESHDQDDHDIIRRSHSTTPTGRNYRTTTTRYSKIPELVHYSDCKYSSPTRPSKIITTATTTTTSYKGPAGNVPLLGEHVTVNTSRGMLVGRVRYIGRTAFASGEWVGIELDEPYGKNDGSVSGRRYFTCPYKYGLFAPIHKVMRGDPVRTVTRTRVEYPKTTQFKL